MTPGTRTTRTSRGEATRKELGTSARYARAFARVRLVRAWIAVLAAIVATVSACLPLLDRVGR